MLTIKILPKIQQYIDLLDHVKYKEISHPEPSVFKTMEHLRSVPKNVNWKEAKIPYDFGENKATFWFHYNIKIPSECSNRDVFLKVPLPSDTLVYINGRPEAAINHMHQKFLLRKKTSKASSFQIHLETYTGHFFPGTHPRPGTDPKIMLNIHMMLDKYPVTLGAASLCYKRENIYDLYYDVFTLFNLAKELDENSLRKNHILQGLYDALNTLSMVKNPDLLEKDAAAVRKKLQPLLKAKNGSTTPELYSVGHAHIDHAWLWPVSETHRKVARTFTNMAGYAEEFPDFNFHQSQPAQIEAMKELYPHIFQKVKKAFSRGQWEPNGAMWVEADCNIPSSESLIRQIIIGHQSTEENFGYRGDTLWLPDVFGYSPALPQILKGTGVDYFVTSKINWNDTTRFPYDSFNWYGVDGTAVKTSFITCRVHGYNARIHPATLKNAWENVQHKELQDGVILSVGEGDGGGGTLRSDLEVMKRIADLEGAPKARWSNVSASLKKIFNRNKNLPDWHGELYLELHRGTYTSQAFVKKYNRKLEFLFREVEALATAIHLDTKKALITPNTWKKAGYKYPGEQLTKCWKEFLIQQFHDIIPGSSINEVYVDTRASYEAIEKDLLELKKKCLDIIAGPDKGTKHLVVYNNASWDRIDLVRLEEPALVKNINSNSIIKSEKSTYPVQHCEDLDGTKVLYSAVSAPPVGLGHCTVVDTKNSHASPFIKKGNTLKTPYYAVTFDKFGRITSLKMKGAEQEYVQPGSCLNALYTAEDYPIAWEAWDIDVHYKLQMIEETRLLKSRVVSDGPLFIKIRNEYLIGEKSKLTQDTVFYSFQERIDFKTHVDWNEDNRLLKASFPVNISSDKVLCEIQNSFIERPTVENTIADRAKFEFFAHKWIALADGGAGVALLNDSKYGFDTTHHDMRITLLRSPKRPDPTCDIGEQEFTYSILPFKSHFQADKITHSAWELNHPLTVRASTSVSEIEDWTFARLNNDSVIIDSIKKCETDNSLIIRLYEAFGREQQVQLKLNNIRYKEIYQTNLMEEKPRKLPNSKKGIPLKFRGFEIKTLKVVI